MNVIYLESLVKDLKKIKDKKLLKNLSTIFMKLENVDKTTQGNLRNPCSDFL